MKARVAWPGVLAAALLACPAAAPAQPADTVQARSEPRPVPTAPRSHPQAAQVTGRKLIDIPQWAKDEGHNGAVTWLATVGPDGKLKSLTLKRSSNSPAIDAAAKAWAEAAYYLAATDAAGAAIEGEAEVRLDYARWDDESPGGGLGDYRCADLVREAEWFAAANAGERKIFTLENFFTSMPGLKAMLDGAATPSIEERQRGYASRGREWQRLLQRCRRSPDRLFLDLVDDAPFYRSLVESF